MNSLSNKEAVGVGRGRANEWLVWVREGCLSRGDDVVGSGAFFLCGF